MNTSGTELRTERLLLRPPVVDDAAGVLNEYAADPEVARYMTWTPHRSVDTVRLFLQGVIERSRGGAEHSWILVSPADGRLLGMLDARIAGHRADIGYVLAREYWQRGYMTEAVTVVTRWLLAQPEIFRVWAVCDIENRGSARVLEKSRFQREGMLRRWIMHPNVSSEPRDCYMYARVR